MLGIASLQSVSFEYYIFEIFGLVSGREYLQCHILATLFGLILRDLAFFSPCGGVLAFGFDLCFVRDSFLLKEFILFQGGMISWKFLFGFK